jgi:hypothetical protein
VSTGPRTSEEDATRRASTSSTPPTATVASRGETETIIGNWFARGGGRRERTVIAIKVCGEMGAEPGTLALEAGLSTTLAADQSALPSMSVVVS